MELNFKKLKDLLEISFKDFKDSQWEVDFLKLKKKEEETVLEFLFTIKRDKKPFFQCIRLYSSNEEKAWQHYEKDFLEFVLLSLLPHCINNIIIFEKQFGNNKLN